MRTDEAEAADKAGDGISEPLATRALREELLLVLRDEIDVLLDVALCHLRHGSDIRFLLRCSLSKRLAVPQQGSWTHPDGSCGWVSFRG